MVNASTVQIDVLRGRQAECREIRRLLAASAGGALLLHGEPGSGRSTLLAYAHRHGRDRRLLAATGLPDEATLPYAGLQRLLGPVLDGAGALPERHRQVLGRAMAGEGCRDQDQLVLSHAVLGLLTEAAHDGPLLCTMDDLDAGDAPTARLLTLVARRLPHLPVVLLLVAGSDSGADAIPHHRLLPLDEPDSHALLAARRPGVAHHRARERAGPRRPRGLADTRPVAGCRAPARGCAGRRRPGSGVPWTALPPEPGCVGRCTCRRRPTDRHRRWPRSWRTLPATVWTPPPRRRRPAHPSVRLPYRRTDVATEPVRRGTRCRPHRPGRVPAATWCAIGGSPPSGASLRLRCGPVPAALPNLLAAASTLADVDRESALVALVRAGEAVCYCGDQYRYAEVARRTAALRHEGDPPWVELLTTLVAGVAATLRGEHAHGGPLLRRAVVLGGRLTGAAATPTALTGAAVAGLLVAVDAAAYRLADHAVERALDRGEVSMLPRALELRAMSEYWLGRHEAATSSCREGLRVARAAGQHTSVGVHLGLLAVLAAVRSDRDTSLGHVAELGDAAVPGSRPHALAQWALALLDLAEAGTPTPPTGWPRWLAPVPGAVRCSSR
ncbi:AAA family ATPase [Verrucosispora sioxanthis]|uniref:AAA family ATPase n=1 Tax=Verrucosispora sioxanthis TaxID=2499994 RepID=UPI0020A22A2B|nr:ATP-binding protein [Verrucosispora sioxanthis]